MSNLWDWSLTFRAPLLHTESGHSPALPAESDEGTTATNAKSELERSVQLSQPQPHKNPWVRQNPRQDPGSPRRVKKAQSTHNQKLPAEADVPEYIATLSLHGDAMEQHKAVGDMALIASYYLLRIGEYTTKETRPNSKCTIKYKLEDLTFFGYNKRGQLRVIPHDAPADVMLMRIPLVLPCKTQ